MFPALAVAERLRSQGVDVVWLGTRHGLEAKVVPQAAFEIAYISISGLRGQGMLRWAAAPFRLSYALLQALIILIRRQPQVVLGMGGFVTGPGGVASWLLRKPLLIHEQNAVAGMTNRILARVASRIMEAFPGTFAPRFRAVCTGNPIRAEIAALGAPDARMAERTGALHLLVLGGSQGSAALNEVVPEAIRELAVEERPRVWHQSGPRNPEAARARYRQLGLEARVDPFIEAMEKAYAWADVVLCRAGAITIAELAAAGLACILVPYPHAVDDHQTYNARRLVDAGAALLMPQVSLSAVSLSGLLRELGRARDRLRDMARAAYSQARPDADMQVANLCREMLRA